MWAVLAQLLRPLFEALVNALFRHLTGPKVKSVKDANPVLNSISAPLSPADLARRYSDLVVANRR